MSTQPEALQLADALETRAITFRDKAEAAAELRKQHDLLGKANALCRIRAAETERLNAEKAELLEALKFYGSSCDATESTPCGYEGNLCCKRARAAIARAEGELNERP
jgi:hypothetical protein